MFFFYLQLSEERVVATWKSRTRMQRKSHNMQMHHSPMTFEHCMFLDRENRAELHRYQTNVLFSKSSSCVFHNVKDFKAMSRINIGHGGY